MERTAREQYLNMLPRQAQTWLLNRNPTTVAEMAQYMREYKLAQKENQGKEPATKKLSSPRASARGSPFNRRQSESASALE